jgi:fatty-acyl-CoA synthase
MGFLIVHVYGLTETYGPYSVCDWHREWDGLDQEQRARLRARQGVGMIQAERMRVVEAELRDGQLVDVPADGTAMGEIVMRGNNVMKGYYRDPEATAKAFAGGWFHSGDLGVLTADGYLSVVDRKKDMIKTGGENVASREVEEAIYELAGVAEVAVFGISHPHWIEAVTAVVVAKPGVTLTAEHVHAHARERLAGYKRPKYVVLADALPKNPSGKILKRELRAAHGGLASDEVS